MPARGAPRWVLAIANDRVLYSNGGAHRECRVSTFTRWIKRASAEVSK